jgi:NAD(P)H dehydrogenase (quinone)
MATKIQVVFYSLYGHVHRLAEEIAAGARAVAGANVELLQVPELASAESLQRSGADKSRAAFAHVPVATQDHLVEADAILFGTPTRFGNMAAPMRAFLDRTGKLWAQNALVGKVGSVFTSTSTQHGGQETTITSFHTTLLHQGMVIVGVPYSCKELSVVSEMSGGSPYGASTITGSDGARQPSANELAVARFQGQHVATIAAKLTA